MSNRDTADTSVQTNDTEAADIVATVDATGLRCPLPLLKAKQALNKLVPGQALRVLASDKGSVRDFHAFARLSGHNLLQFNERDGIYDYVLQKSPQA